MRSMTLQGGHFFDGAALDFQGHQFIGINTFPFDVNVCVWDHVFVMLDFTQKVASNVPGLLGHWNTHAPSFGYARYVAEGSSARCRATCEPQGVLSRLDLDKLLSLRFMMPAPR